MGRTKKDNTDITAKAVEQPKPAKGAKNLLDGTKFPEAVKPAKGEGKAMDVINTTPE